MKVNVGIFSRVFVVVVLIASVVASCNVYSKSGPCSAHPVIKVFSSDKDLIDDALKTMKSSIDGINGSPYVVSCTYRIIGKCPIKVTTKVYFSDYHKRPISRLRTFVEDSCVDIDRIVEVVYKATAKGNVSLIERDPKDAFFKKIRTCKIAVSKSIFA